jgi:hypothetical protein
MSLALPLAGADYSGSANVIIEGRDACQGSRRPIR